jgi:glycosyltransferase involved in cell wall biosynthesis
MVTVPLSDAGIVGSAGPVPRVSVLVPAYNAEQHLPRAILSVLGQSYTDWELIVADDGSTDATSAVAEGFGSRVRVVRSPVNRGLAATRNLALEHAQGDLVALLDSDDAWLPGYLEQQVDLHERTGASIVCCDAFLEREGRRLPELYGDRFGRPSGPVTAITLLRSNPIFVSVLCRRTVVVEAGMFDTTLRSVEDLDLWLRIVESGGTVAYNPAALVIYRLAEGTLSTDTLRMARSRQYVFERALDRGRLDAEAAREARRALRLQRAVEQVELARRAGSLRAIARLAAATPLLAHAAFDRIRR